MIENQLETAKKSIFLGFSKKYTLYDSGCLVHALARLIGKPVLEVHDRLKQFKCFFADSTGDVCLLDLTKVPSAYPELEYIGKETEWNQDKALAAIAQAGGLIVEVDSNSIMNGTQQHFVYFRGNGEMEDSLGAKVRPTTYYKVISMRVFYKKVIISQPEVPTMSEDDARALKIISGYRVEAGHGNNEGAANAAVGAARDYKKLEDQIINDLKQKIIFLANLIKSEEINDDKLSKITEKQKLDDIWQTLIESAKKYIETLTTAKNDNFTNYRNKNNEFNAMKYMVGDLTHLITFALMVLGKKDLEAYLKEELPKIIILINKNDQNTTTN